MELSEMPAPGLEALCQGSLEAYRKEQPLAPLQMQAALLSLLLSSATRQGLKNP